MGKMKDLTINDTPAICVVCDAPARFFYPAPMCVPCNRDWAE